MTEALDRILLHVADGRRRVVDPSEVSYLESTDDETRIHLLDVQRPLVDVRTLGEVAPLFAPFGFLRVHRTYAVNLRRILEIRRRDRGRDWELVLGPPANRVLPVSRNAFDDLLLAFGKAR